MKHSFFSKLLIVILILILVDHAFTDKVAGVVDLRWDNDEESDSDQSPHHGYAPLKTRASVEILTCMGEMRYEASSMNEHTQPELPDIRQRGRAHDGSVIFSSRTLFFQLLRFRGSLHLDAAKKCLDASGLDVVLYADVSDPSGFGFLTMSEDETHFSGPWRTLLSDSVFAGLTLDPSFTMMGRTYSIGYESDLDHVLVNRPRKRALDPELRFVVWYPLRRIGAFAKLEPAETRDILGEHGRIGNAYGSANLATDIRLASFGLDTHDNDFTVALLGAHLAPLSHVVETMRKTRQTSEFMEKMGPFFVAHVLHQTPISRS